MEGETTPGACRVEAQQSGDGRGVVSSLAGPVTMRGWRKQLARLEVRSGASPRGEFLFVQPVERHGVCLGCRG